jgi:hypothetical protein
MSEISGGSYMKKVLVILIVAVSLLAMSCATFWAPGVGSTTIPGGLSNVNANVSKVGESTNRVWLGIFGSTNGYSAIEVAQANGITKIAEVDYAVTPGILGLWIDYTVRVAGE